MADTTSFGQWLKQRRKALDLTREALAAEIGYAANTIYKIETDERRASKQVAELLAQYINIPTDEQAAFIRFARGEAAETPTPWGTAFQTPNNLPTSPTLLIGRDADVTAIRKRLLQTETQLLTLIGPPGIGKTRLGLQVARKVLGDFEDGVFFVALAPITDTELVLKTVMIMLDLQEVGRQTPLERLRVFLRDKQILLVLDNFEQILSAAPHIDALLAACPRLKILVTSRAPLRIRRERQLPISPLKLPDLAHLPQVETVAAYSAVTLFIERAQAVKPDFLLTEENAGTVAAICTRLDGLPLAIELISARVKLLTPSALLERLHGRLMLQSDGLRDIEPRHRTLNTAIDWSYQQLNADEQTLFRRLGVFVGGWTLEAAEVICADNLKLNILDGLVSLLDKNLIKQEMDSNGEHRFMMLETILEYAREKLSASGEANDLHQHHFNYFFKLAEESESYLYKPEQNLWLDRLEVEWGNLRAALTWSQDMEAGLDLAATLGWFFYLRSYWNEGPTHLERALSANPNASALLRATALNRYTWLVRSEQVRLYANEALALARSNNDRCNTAWALVRLGSIGEDTPYETISFLDESLHLFRELNDSLGINYALYRRTYRAIDQKDYTYARTLLKEMEVRSREANDKYMAANACLMLGRVVWAEQGNLPQVKAHYEQALSLFREARFPGEVNRTVSMLAEIELALGNYEQSEKLSKEALVWEMSLDYPQVEFQLACLATIAKVRGQLERAAKLLGAASSDWMIKFSTLHPYIVPYERDIADVREALGKEDFDKAWNTGKAMSVEAIAAYALNEGS